MSVSDDSWPLSSSSFQDWQSKINEIQLTKTSQPNSRMNQENQNLMTELAGKPSFTCKQPSLCKWPINLWEPDVPVYSHCLPSCPALWWTGGCHHPSAASQAETPCHPNLDDFLIPNQHSLISRLDFIMKRAPSANEMKDGCRAFNKVLHKNKNQTLSISKWVHALVLDMHTRELQHH